MTAPLHDGGVPLHDFAYPKDAQKNIATMIRTCTSHASTLRKTSQRVPIPAQHRLDFNRAGTPLMEIVTQPEISSPEEAFAFITPLKQILIYGA